VSLRGRPNLAPRYLARFLPASTDQFALELSQAACIVGLFLG
jgi:hypothetical protein